MITKISILNLTSKRLTGLLARSSEKTTCFDEETYSISTFKYHLLENGKHMDCITIISQHLNIVIYLFIYVLQYKVYTKTLKSTWSDF